MVRANFWSVFVGIESPSAESLTQMKKFQNLRNDPLECIRTIQRGGLWVTGGFIVGFDADTDDIFDRQVDFIERAAVVCAMTGFLEALPTTPLYDRLKLEGRLLEDARPKGIHKPPNFRTRMPLRTLLVGNRKILRTIYAPSTYFARALRSLEDWTASEHHHLPKINVVAVLAKSFVKQGLASPYRRDYWNFLFSMIKRWRGHADCRSPLPPLRTQSERGTRSRDSAARRGWRHRAGASSRRRLSPSETDDGESRSRPQALCVDTARYRSLFLPRRRRTHRRVVHLPPIRGADELHRRRAAG
jgi:hypothetical protein